VRNVHGIRTPFDVAVSKQRLEVADLLSKAEERAQMKERKGSV
jgi:hypothetical protein